MKVRDILAEKKDSEIYSVHPMFTVFEALTLMAEKNIGAVLVLDNGNLEGIFTERDYARKVVLKGKISKEIHVNEVMNTDVVTITENMEIDECMNLMTNKFVRHLPVLRNNQLVGMISIGDVVKSIINEQQFIIENLGNYIAGTK
jgi:CBS domain-containing protein